MTSMNHFLTRTLLCCMTLVLTLSVSSVAQDAADSLEAGSLLYSRAFQFHLLGGPGISYVAPLAGRSAFRFSANIELNSTALDGVSTQITSAIDSIEEDRNLALTTSRSRWGFDLTASYIHYIPLSGRTYGFLGIGPFGRHSWSSNESTSLRIDTSSAPEYHVNARSTGKEWGIGLRGTLGIQTFVTRAISLIGELQVSGLYLWIDQTTESNYIVPPRARSRWKTNQKGPEFDLRLARLGVAIHF